MSDRSLMWTTQTLKLLVSTANSVFQKILTTVEIDGLFMFTKQLRLEKSAFKTDQELCTFVVNSYRKFIDSKKGIDVQDLLIEQINTKDNVVISKSSIEGAKTTAAPSKSTSMLPSASELIAMTQILNRESIIRESIVLFDSRYQSRSNVDRSRFVFNVISDTKNKEIGQSTYFFFYLTKM